MSEAEYQSSTTTAVLRSQSRRSLFGAGAALLVATPAVAASDVGDDSALVVLADEIMTIEAESDRLAQIEQGIPDLRARHRFSEQHIRPLTNRVLDLMATLATMRATTIEGFRAKARVIQRFNNCAPGYASPDQDDAMAWSLSNDLLGVESVWQEEART